MAVNLDCQERSLGDSWCIAPGGLRRAQEGSEGLRRAQGAQEATPIASPVREFRLNQ